MALKAYEELAAEPLVFPVGGKFYTHSPIGVVAGMRLAGVLTGVDSTLNELPAQELWKLVLGSLWDEMLADDVPAEAVARAGMAALADFQYGRATAEAMWETGDSPEALAARVAANSKASKRSTSSGAAGKTRSRASMSGTTPRPVTRQPAKKKPAAPSRGSRSSSSGN